MSDAEDVGRAEVRRGEDHGDRQQPERPERSDPSSPTGGADLRDGTRDAETSAAEERQREEARIRGASQNPLHDEGEPEAAQDAPAAVHQVRTRRTAGGSSYVVDGNTILGGHFGDAYHQFLLRSAPPLLAGPVPAEELATLHGVYCEPDGYAAMRRALADFRVLALCGEPGSGRSSTALHLLHGLTAEKISRLDPDTDLTELPEDDIENDHGYLLELEGSSTVGPPSRMHLDRLGSLLARRRSYCVLLVDGVLAERLVRGRYGRHCPPPAAAAVLERHLEQMLEARREAVSAALATAGREDVRQALGLDELRPREAFRLAEMLAAHQAGKMSDGDLLIGCQEFAPRQVQAWFAGIDRAGSLPEVLPSLRAAAFRIALAVFNGASYNLVVEAGERLAREFAVTFDPDSNPGRLLFADEPAARLLTARSTLENEQASVGTAAQVPIRTVRFLGDRLAPAVLDHLWTRHHNARGPVGRWLQELCQDRRPEVWVRAALAAGALAARDFTDTFEELVAPMAASPRVRHQLFAAIAADQAARSEPVRAAIRSRVRDWGRSGGSELRRTAAMAHGYGRVAGSVAASLGELRRIGVWEDGRLLNVAGFGVVQLLGGRDPQAVLDRIADWLQAERRDEMDLGLVSVIRMAHSRTDEVWDPEVSDDLEPYAGWPLPIALATAHPGLAEPLAGLIRRALGTPRSRESTLTAVADWAARANQDGRLDSLVQFLPRLIGRPDDADRLRWMVRRLVYDPSDPMPKEVARRIWFSLEEEKV